MLRVHENVMAVMMNTLGRRAQAQSDAPQVGTGQEGEAPAKEKVRMILIKFKLNKYCIYRNKFVATHCLVIYILLLLFPYIPF